jgi:hypothetical protein
MGKLVMDGRHFTLVVKVKNPAEHKRIIKSSNICVIYLEITRTAEDKKIVKEQLAAAVTDGTMRSLFIGKHGVFFDSDGVIYDAVIRDMVEQPVSIGEAFKAPFFQFADFLSKQTEKIFNTRNAEMQKNLSTELNKAAVPVKPAAKPAAVPAANSSMPMLLMGGGIGVAALGSSIAFIAKSLQNVSFSTVLAVLALLRKKCGPYRLGRRSAAWWAGLLALIAPLVIGGLAALDFDRAFVIFHKIFFPGKSNWLFDWRTDPIILALPQEFFRNCAILIGAGLVVFSLGLLIFSGFRDKNTRTS